MRRRAAPATSRVIPTSAQAHTFSPVNGRVREAEGLGSGAAFDEDDAPVEDGLTLLGGAEVRLFEPEPEELVVVVVVVELCEPAEEPGELEWWWP